MTAIQTQGVHHLGLTVSRLEASAAFFVDTLGWREVRRDPDYPAIFVSDGTVMVTLWQAAEPDTARPFDPRRQVGLHHVAFRVPSREALAAIHRRLQTAPGVRMEFAPEPLHQGPAWHTMCYEPSGVRVEFICWPQEEG